MPKWNIHLAHEKEKFTFWPPALSFRRYGPKGKKNNEKIYFIQ